MDDHPDPVQEILRAQQLNIWRKQSVRRERVTVPNLSREQRSSERSAEDTAPELRCLFNACGSACRAHGAALPLRSVTQALLNIGRATGTDRMNITREPDGHAGNHPEPGYVLGTSQRPLGASRSSPSAPPIFPQSVKSRDFH
ncbi:unnamed protein product [Pleuronectes platessa]|uniref:Uncharacterized protein n=1 Tax=Pleuronectes platessa TaxID=8262 RepID=A0A9N7TJM4_PLEPL|nr:unnamed protein product [Pleuronectes platessa]